MNIINLGILAHVDAGKTTVTEGLLVHSGVKRRMGRVDDGTTTTDSMAVERERGMTVRAATVSFAWQGVKINLIDTPGHMDFIAEVERSLAVLDGVVLVLSAREGVQPQTRVIFEKLRAMRIPTIFYINKIDRMGVALDAVYADITARLSPAFVPMQRVEGAGSRDAAVFPLPLAGLVEAIAEHDDALLEAYLEGKALTDGDVAEAIRRQTQACALYPVYHGAALHDVGTEPLLDAIVTHFARPMAVSVEGPTSAYIYKVEWDAAGHKRAYMRVLSGAVCIREKIPHPGHEEPVYVRGLFTVLDGGIVPATTVEAGDIGILMDTPHVRCGDFIGREMPLPGGISATQPLLSVGIEAQKGASRPALLSALQRLEEEDPLLSLSIHPVTEEIILRLYGVLQREILYTLLRERFGIDAAFSPVRTLRKAKPLAPTQAEIRIGSADNLHEAGIALTIQPLPPGGGIVYETKVSYGALEKSYQNAVEEGVLRRLQEGLGDEIVDTKVTFTDMDYSSVTSTPADYRRLAPQVVRMALEKAGIIEYEPWMRYQLSAPMAFQKKVLSALMRLGASLEEALHGVDEFTAQGEVPLDTAKDFAAALLSMTQGQGLFDLTFLEYRRVPDGVQEKEPGKQN